MYYLFANFELYTIFPQKIRNTYHSGVFDHLGFLPALVELEVTKKWWNFLKNLLHWSLPCVDFSRWCYFNRLSVGVDLPYFRSRNLGSGWCGRRKLKCCIKVVNHLYYKYAKFHQNRKAFRVKGLVRNIVPPRKKADFFTRNKCFSAEKCNFRPLIFYRGGVRVRTAGHVWRWIELIMRTFSSIKEAALSFVPVLYQIEQLPCGCK